MFSPVALPLGTVMLTVNLRAIVDSFSDPAECKCDFCQPLHTYILTLLQQTSQFFVENDEALLL